MKELTPRQIEAMRALVEHGTHDKAAAALGIKPSTMRDHIMGIQERLGTLTTTHSAAVMEARGELRGVPLPNEVKSASGLERRLQRYRREV